MKPLILTTNTIFITLVLFLTNRDDIHQRWKDSESSLYRYEVRGISKPQDLLTAGNSLYILKEGSLINWDISGRKVLETEVVSPETILDSEHGNFFSCSWENYEISSPEEFATVITWRNDLGEIKEIPIKKTVKPTRCLKDKIIAMNAFPTLEEKYYEIKIEDKTLNEISFSKDLVRSIPEGLEVDNTGRIFVTNKEENSLKKRLLFFFKSIVKDIQPR